MYLNIVPNDQASNFYNEMQPAVSNGQQDQKWSSQSTPTISNGQQDQKWGSQSNSTNGWHTPSNQSNGWHTPATQTNGWHTPAASSFTHEPAKVLQVGARMDIYDDPTQAANNLGARMAVHNTSDTAARPSNTYGQSSSTNGQVGTNWYQSPVAQPQATTNDQMQAQTGNQVYSNQSSQASSKPSPVVNQYQSNVSQTQTQGTWNQQAIRQPSLPPHFSTIKQDPTAQVLQEGSRMSVYNQSPHLPTNQMQTNSINRGTVQSALAMNQAATNNMQSATSSMQSNANRGQVTPNMNPMQTNQVQSNQINSMTAAGQPAKQAPQFNSPHAPSKPNVVTNYKPGPVGQILSQSQTAATARPSPFQSQMNQSNTRPTTTSSTNQGITISRPQLNPPNPGPGRPSLASQLNSRINQTNSKPTPSANDKPTAPPEKPPAQNSIPCAPSREKDTSKDSSDDSKPRRDTVFGSSSSDTVFGSSIKTSQDSSDSDLKIMPSSPSKKLAQEVFLDDESDDDSDIKCDKCKQSFWFKKELVSHLRDVHNMSEADQEEERKRKVAAAAAIREQMRKKALAKQMILYQRLQQKKMEEQRAEVMANKQQLQRALARANETARLRQERKLAEERNSLELRREMQALQERKTRAKRLELQMLLDRRNRLMGRAGNSDREERSDDRDDRAALRERVMKARSRDHNNNTKTSSSKSSQRQIHLDSGIVIEALPF